MDRRFRARLDELLGDAVVDPAVVRGMLPRLERFFEPFAARLDTPAPRLHARQYVSGLISALKRKTAEGIAYLHDQERQGLQKFIGQQPWEHSPLINELVGQVGVALGQPDGVLVFDPSAFPKKGKASVGVQRQWCGRLGKLDNCQVGVYLGYVSRTEHALVDFRLYLPKDWAQDKQRREKAGVPKKVKFQTRHALALEMLAADGPLLPHAWVAGDDEMGRCTWFRQRLQALEERYLLAVPSNTLMRDLEVVPPASSGPGRPPQVPFVQVARWCAALPATAWVTVDVRDGEKGPLVVEAVKVRVRAKTAGGRVGPEEVLVIVRERQADSTWKHDYYLSNAPPATPLAEFVRVAKAEHRIEECLQRAKSEAGLGHYQVQTWEGWHHHQTLSLIATWFLTQEARRGKKMDPGIDRTTGGRVPWPAIAEEVRMHSSGTNSSHSHTSRSTYRDCAALPLETTQTLGTTAS